MATSTHSPRYDLQARAKDEVMDLDFTLDADHRKRRRNRTTQSCLNCHTSKRKCDRKRPCQRCIQLGLTGLCVYEIDDPASRDDPSVDESTRLRNRIAELESLVRELRGKPHPRWADGNFRDGDQNERWHSRAQKFSPQLKRSVELEVMDDLPERETQLSPKRSDTRSDGGNQSPSLFSFSPTNSAIPLRYNTLSVPSTPHFLNEDSRRQSYESSSTRASTMSFSSSSSAPTIAYLQRNPDSGSTYSNSSSSGGYDHEFEDDRHYGQRYPQSSSPGSFCACRTDLTSAHALTTLSHSLQNATNILRQYAQHGPESHCLLHRRIVELNHLMQISGTSSRSHLGPGATYGPGALPTPTDSDMISPLSSAGSPYDPPSTGHHGQSWDQIAAAGFNPYFPLPPGSENVLYGN